MKENRTGNDLIEELERMDRFFDGEEPGERPLDVLRERGIDIRDEKELADGELHESLWTLLRAMKDIGLYLESTDHLSDRELYRYLVDEALAEETILSDGVDGGWFLSPIGGCSEEDIDIYLRYYADDEERESFRANRDRPLPAKENKPWDRDRILPQHEPRATF